MEFIVWFKEAAEEAGLTTQDAMREALAEWAKKQHP